MTSTDPPSSGSHLGDGGDDDLIHAGEAARMVRPWITSVRQLDTLVSRGLLEAHQPTPGQWRTFRRGAVRRLVEHLRAEAEKTAERPHE